VFVGEFHSSSLAYIARMHPLEQYYVGGVDEALTSLGMSKEALSPEEKAKMLEAYRARPKGVAAVQGAAGQFPPAGRPSMAPGPASQAQMTNPATPPILPGASPLQLDRSGYQGGYGTGGIMPGATMGARGQVSGLPNKLASFFL
jgi:hypothetical protein